MNRKNEKTCVNRGNGVSRSKRNTKPVKLTKKVHENNQQFKKLFSLCNEHFIEFNKKLKKIDEIERKLNKNGKTCVNLKNDVSRIIRKREKPIKFTKKELKNTKNTTDESFLIIKKFFTVERKCEIEVDKILEKLERKLN